MDLEAALRDVFGLPGFRPGQREVVESVLSGRPTVAVMPTGAGKSLCFQLPAVVTGGTALVVSPLIALMKDQVDALTARGVPAAAVTSAISVAEQQERLRALEEGRLRLLYVAPERFRNARFDDVLERAASRITVFAVDEAHCISEWGHDFRPDYRRLGEWIARARPPRLVALTATATPEVRRDIAGQLGLEDPAVFVRGFDRPNLHLAVERVDGLEAKARRLRELIAEARGDGSVIAYAATRKNAEAHADALAARGVRAAAYHAGLADERRRRVQEAFMGGELDVVVATNAFGMGIDKADVRLVVHADVPRSPEAYYQEAGRGGRDGRPARCVLLFSHADVKLQEFLIAASCPSAELLRALWRELRDDPRTGAEPAALRRRLPGGPSEAAVGAATSFLVKAGYLREVDGVLEALHPGDPGVPPPAPIDADALEARLEMERHKLRAIVDYAYAASCRRRYLLSYFGDPDGRGEGSCASCDVCEGARSARVLDDEEAARVRATLRLVAELRGRFGRSRVAALLVGDEEDELAGAAELPGRGRLRRQGTRYALDLLRSLEGAGLLVRSPGEYPTVAITARGRELAAGAGPLELALAPPAAAVAGGRRRRRRDRERGGAVEARAVVEARAAVAARSARGGRKEGARVPGARRAPRSAGASGVAPQVEVGPLDLALVERLRALRSAAAAEEDVPAYCVFPNRTLEAIARVRPTDAEGLALVPGMGPARVERWGRAILAAVRGE